MKYIKMVLAFIVAVGIILLDLGFKSFIAWCLINTVVQQYGHHFNFIGSLAIVLFIEFFFKGNTKNK